MNKLPLFEVAEPLIKPILEPSELTHQESEWKEVSSTSPLKALGSVSLVA